VVASLRIPMSLYGLIGEICPVLGVREREDDFGPHQEAFWREDTYADVSTAPILIGTVFETHSYLRHSFSLSHLGCDCVYFLVVEKLAECEDLILD
jgi:hypothetical protein